MPKLSIIVPVYNVEDYLEECLDSVLCQDFADIEIICVNDGSTDASLHILEKMEKKSPLIKVFSKENGGLSSARNYGIKKATGQYLYFLDSDDRLASADCLSFMVHHMNAENLDVLYFDGKSFYEKETLCQDNSYYDSAYNRKKEYGIYSSGQHLFADMVIAGDYYVPVWIQCYRADFLKEIDLWFDDGLIYEDNIFTFISILSAGKVAHYKKTVLERRIREGSIMQRKLKFINVYSRLFTYKKMLAYWEKNKFSQEVQVAISLIVKNEQSGTLKMYNALEKEEQNKINSLAGIESYLMNSLVRSLGKIVDDRYVFPYHFFAAGSKIIIYGAGNVGKHFYFRALKDEIIDVVGVVDARALEMSTDEIPVLPIEMIKQLEYDYILIAVEKELYVSEIKHTLRNLGVQDEKIKWDGNFYDKKKYWQRAYECQNLMQKLGCDGTSLLC